jgi:hypothetical protein
VFSQKIAAFFSLAIAAWELIFAVKVGADLCAGYLLSLYLVPQIGFFVFVACNQVFLGDRTFGQHRKLTFPWLDLIVVGFWIQLAIIVFNFVFNTHSGHC